MSPMKDVQKQYHPVFRLRFGEKGPRGEPRKLTDAIRVTSFGQEVVEAFTAVYGGEARPWQSPDGAAWEARLPITELSILMMPGQSVRQNWERWRGGATCERLCDGYTEEISGKSCMCPADIKARMQDPRACKPTTYVTFICPDVSITWAGDFVSRGMTAAATLPQSAWLLEEALQRGLRVPATLRVTERRGRRNYIVPVIVPMGFTQQTLETGEFPRALRDGNGGHEIAAPATRALESGGAVDDGGEEVSRVVHQPARLAGSGGTESDGPGDPAPPRPPSPRPASPEPESAIDLQRQIKERREQPPLPHEIEGAAEVPATVAPTTEEPDNTAAPSLPAANTVAMWCREAGLTTDEQRHEFLATFSSGRYTSGHDIPADEMDALREALALWTTEPDDYHAEPSQPMDRDAWRAAFADVPGVGEATFMKQARKTAEELGVPTPMSLNDITDPKLVAALHDWLQEQPF